MCAGILEYIVVLCPDVNINIGEILARQLNVRIQKLNKLNKKLKNARGNVVYVVT